MWWTLAVDLYINYNFNKIKIIFIYNNQKNWLWLAIKPHLKSGHFHWLFVYTFKVNFVSSN